VLLFATTVGVDVFYSVVRQAPDDWWESLLFKNDILIGSWLSKPWGDGGLCNTAGPQLWRGEANMLLIRMQAETSPWLFSAAPDQHDFCTALARRARIVHLGAHELLAASRWALFPIRIHIHAGRVRGR
jgi:hypothetical protein